MMIDQFDWLLALGSIKKRRMQTKQVVYLDGKTLTLPLLDAIVRHPHHIDLSKESWKIV